MPTFFEADPGLAKSAGATIFRVLRRLPTMMLASTLPGEAAIELQTTMMRLIMRRDRPEKFEEGMTSAIPDGCTAGEQCTLALVQPQWYVRCPILYLLQDRFRRRIRCHDDPFFWRVRAESHVETAITESTTFQ